MGPMPELADYSADFEQFQPPPPLPPQPPSQAEQRRLQQYFDHRNRVDTDEGEANIDFDTAEAARQQLDQAAAPLMQKASEWEQYQKQQQRAQITDEMAFEQSIKRANMAHDAQGFPEHMSHQMLVGPDGMPQQVSFYQTEPGKWAQADLAPVTSAEGLGDTTPAPDTGEADVSDGLPSMRTEQPGQGETSYATSEPDGSQRMTIWNGGHRTEALYGPNGQLVGQQTFAPNGQPMGQAAPPRDDGRGRFFAQAAQMVGPPPPQSWRGVHGQQIPNPQYGRWQAAVSSQATRLLQEDIAIKREERKAQADAEKEHADKWVANYDKYYNSAVSHWEKANKDKEMPDDVRKRLNAQAEERADQAHKSAYGKLPKAREEDLQREADQAFAEAKAGVDKINATGGPTGNVAPQQPTRIADVHQVINASELPDEQKSLGLGAAETVKSIVAKYGGLDKAPPEEKAIAQAAAKRLDKVLTEAKKKKAKPLENAGLQGFLN